MRAKLFQLVWHSREGSKNEPILAIDFHPLHSILVTAGMDRLVRFWRVRDPSVDSGGVGAGTSAAAVKGDNSATVEFLMTMSLHAKTVNVVRWSPDGESVASAGDEEGMVVVCKPKPGMTWLTVVTERDLVRTIIRVDGNKHEAYDLSWAPDSRHLALAFVNNRAVALSLETRRAVGWMGGHSQFVQGVAWDPANAYVATQSNDRSVRVFRNPAALQAPGAAGGKAGKGTKAKASGPDTEWPLVQAMRMRDPRAAATASAAAAASSGAAASAIVGTDAAEGAVEAGATAAAATAAATKRPAPSAASAPHHHLYLDESVPTFFRRLAWTPDGSLLITPAGLFKGPMLLPGPRGAVALEGRPTTYAFARDRLAAPIAHFPGTRQSKASVIVRCSPVLYKLRHVEYPTAAGAAVAASASSGGNLEGSAAVEALESSDAAANSAATVAADAGSMQVDAPTAAAGTAAAGTAAAAAAAAAITGAPLLPSRRAAAAAHGNPAFALPYRMLVAVATLDAVHIYDTQQALPLVTLAGFHVDKITDVAWAPSGAMLFVASWDGYVSCAAFAPGELGEPLEPALLPPVVAARRAAAAAAHAALAAATAAGAGGAAAAAATAAAAGCIADAASAATTSVAAAATAAPAAAVVSTLQPRKRLQPVLTAAPAAAAAAAAAAPASNAAAAAAPAAADHRVAMAGPLPAALHAPGAAGAAEEAPASPTAAAAASGGPRPLASSSPGPRLPSMLSVAAMSSPPRSGRAAAAAANAAEGATGSGGSAPASASRRRIAPAPVAAEPAAADMPPASGGVGEQSAARPSPKRPRLE